MPEVATLATPARDCRGNAGPSIPGAMLTVREVARRLSVSRSAVYQLMDGGELAFYRLGKRGRRIAEADLAALLARTRVGAA